jgi:hypothetical protein
MTPLQTVLLVLGILGLQLVVWVPIIIWWKRRTRALKAALPAEALIDGEHLRRGPESANYRGASAGYTRVKGNGVLVLTDRQLHFRKLTGGRIDVPLAEIVGVREARWFQGSGGQTHLILQLQSGAEVAFIVTDLPGWRAALRDALATAAPSGERSEGPAMP